MKGHSSGCPPLAPPPLGQWAWEVLRKDLRELMERQLAEQEQVLARHLAATQEPTFRVGDGRWEEPGGAPDSLVRGYSGGGESLVGKAPRSESCSGHILSTRVWDGLQRDLESESTQRGPLRRYLPWRSWAKDHHEPKHVGDLAELLASRRFELLVVLLISSNCCFIVYSANYVMEHPEGPNSWMRVAEACFCIAFLLELGIRLAVRRIFFFCSADWKWNWWDFVMVISAAGDVIATNIIGERAIDLQYLRTLRVLRVFKILRLVRVLRFSRELRLMLDCLMNCAISMFWSLLMLVFILFLASMFFVQRLGSFWGGLSNDELSAFDPDKVEILKFAFPNIQGGMLSLFKAVTGGDDWGWYLSSLWITGWIDGCAFLGFIALFNIAVMNIVTSIFLDKVMVAAQPETHELIHQKNVRDREEAREIMRHFSRMDEGTGCVTRETFVDHMRRDPEIRELLDLWGLAIGDPGQFFDVIAKPADTSPDGVRVAALAKTCLGLRGPATAVDLNMLGHAMWKMQERQQRFEGHCIERLEAMDRILAASGPGAASREEDSSALRSVLREIYSIRASA